MDETLYNDELLIRYLDGELSAEEKTALEERLHTDKALQEQLVHLQVAVQAVKYLGTTERVQAVHAEMMKELKATNKGKVVPFSKLVRYTMAVAASILVLFVGVRLYLNAQLSPEKLYNESFVDFNVSAARGSNENFSEIEKHYQQKAYEAVIGDVRSVNMDAKDSLLVGLAYLHQNRTPQAIGIFQRLANSANNFQQDAEFYLSLSYLKNKEYSKALPLMEKIKNTPSHLYREYVTEKVIEKTKKLNDK
ncbi:tetratricopeptide repeat protein [Flavisolibacter ginsenosidimutans]|uniref:Tetratricopeptide repeat protein n=1 Tax=Flavisolibacter ginsenosidimutans TaxID=661481 RepID=A0A5B8UI17_9BACT|nr:tetratricopeptide repeat protein [Flavisolibacter ginsenosidimutans]QEC56163.1 tetratricopeptide repeat protein [Flavisolibacter ginsenosidimutans]